MVKKQHIDNKQVRQNFRKVGIRRRSKEAKSTRYKLVIVHTVFAQFGSRFYIYDDNSYWEDILYEYKQDVSDSSGNTDSDLVTDSK